jgi:hypothetical protein
VDPLDVFVAVHEDEAGVARVVFVMNPTPNDVNARISLAGVGALVDALGEERIARAGGAFDLSVPARTVRMMIVEASRDALQ